MYRWVFFCVYFAQAKCEYRAKKVGKASKKNLRFL